VGNLTLQRVEAAATHELVVEEIRRAIHMGLYVPGDHLPAERALAEQLGVSRATLREALGVLRNEGYVESRRGAHGGLVVLDQGIDEERMRPVVQERLREFEELLDLREAIEGAAARLAAERRTASDIKTLTTAFRAMARGLETERFRAADSTFHMAVAAAARNRMMERAIEEARAKMWMPIDDRIEKVFPSAHRHHERILTAIREQNPRAAERAAVAHLEVVRHDLRRAAGADRPATKGRGA
jgi:GntR family transcriptional regulator, transcriptional repressor for pyruvate dehydrogenase complex